MLLIITIIHSKIWRNDEVAVLMFLKLRINYLNYEFASK